MKLSEEDTSISDTTALLPIVDLGGGGRGGKASAKSGVVNLVSTIIGGAVLSLPFAFKTSGLALGLILLLAFYCLTQYTANLLITVSAQAGNGITYSQLSKQSFGRGGAVLYEACVVVFLMGALVGYNVILGDVFTSYIQRGAPDFPRPVVILIISALLPLPLSMLRRIDSLKISSLIALLLIGYLIICVMVGALAGERDLQWATLYLWRADARIFATLPVISFAFTFHPSLLLIWNELKDTRSVRVRFMVAASASICFVCYALVATFGYLSFGEDLSDNLLTHYGENAVYMDIAKIGYGAIIAFSYPLLCFPTREAVIRVITTIRRKPEGHEMSRKGIIVVVFCLWAISYFLSILPIGIGVVFGLTGATAGNLIVLTLPALFYIVLMDVPRCKKILPGIVVLLSLFLMCAGIFALVVFDIAPGFDEALEGDLQDLINATLVPFY